MRLATPLLRARATQLPLLTLLAISLPLVWPTRVARAAGILTATGSPQQPIQIRDHHVDVLINNGFARTTVTQTFFNPNANDLEAVYSFPVPRSASLAEVTVWNGERETHGEVIDKEEAARIYKEEKDKGNESGIAEKNAFYTFDFGVSPVRANSEVRIRFVYYQPLEVDTGVGRYVYPLQDGGTDDATAMNFWTTNAKVENSFSMNVELKSAWPVADIRMPGVTPDVNEKLGDGHHRIRFDRNDAKLDRDFVLYYKLADNLPGRIELIPYRAARDKPGTFMMVVTPGVDLQPLTGGADYTFVLDVSGSMQTKIRTLADGVVKVLGTMKPQDRFRIITFSYSAQRICDWTPATPENVTAACERIKSLTANGSTNLFAGVTMALQGLDADRCSSIVLVTDGVTNTGVVAPDAFHKLLAQYDVRVFGFLMGNSGNWPLMRTICDATGGFYAGVSNDDDIVGQIMLAKGKITHEALHDAKLTVSGVDAEKVTDVLLGKVYRGQQLVMFGRYDKPGKATVTLKAKLTGQDKAYSTTFEFPETATENPEIERLWALNQIELIEVKENAGQLPEHEAKTAIRDLGLQYQIVTDHTSMLVLADEAFQKHGIERRNQQRVAVEHAAQAAQANQPPRNNRIDQPQPAFDKSAPHVGNGGGNGGGAIDPISGAIVLGLAAVALSGLGRRKGGRR